MDTNTNSKQIVKKKIIGITGGMGSGKSTVTSVFEKEGAIAIYADRLARAYTEKDTPIKEELESIFGKEVIVNGIPDRKFIASQVFTDTEKLQKLTAIIHPLVRQKTEAIISGAPDDSILAWEVPLLFETGGEKICTHTIVVYANPEISLKRVRDRDGLTEEEYWNRMRNQLPLEEKIKRAMFRIENNSSLEVLEMNTKRIFQHILRGEN